MQFFFRSYFFRRNKIVCRNKFSKIKMVKKFQFLSLFQIIAKYSPRGVCWDNTKRGKSCTFDICFVTMNSPSQIDVRVHCTHIAMTGFHVYMTCLANKLLIQNDVNVKVCLRVCLCEMVIASVTELG